MALTDFLSDEQGNVQGPGSSYVLANKSMDWAAEMEQLDTAYPEPYADKMVDRTKLPTAPKASRGADYDIEKMPTEPPYTAFIGNLPYEATEEMIEQFFCKLAVLNVRLPEDNGRLRGFGYVEFETQQALIDSLAMSEDSMGGRKIRVDLAGQNQQHPGSGRDAGRGGDPDRSEGDWRRPSAAAPESGGGSAWGRDRDGDRNSSKDGGGRAEQDGPWQRSGSSFQDRGSRGGFEDRGGSRGGGFDDRGGGYNRDRGFGGGGGGFDRDGDRDGGRRGFGSGFDRDGGDRRGYGNRSGGFGDRDRGSFGGDRDRGSFGGDRDRGSFGGDRDRGYGGDRDRGFGGDRGGERSERYEPREPREPASGASGASDTAKERPRLQLQPRSKPAEKSGGETSSSIFGGAKPVDTAQREREIEERLLKQRQEQAVAPLPRSSFSNRYDDDKENRDTYDSEHSSAVSSRKRSDSDRSHDGDGRRERRLSSGSGKGRKAPPITSQRSRKDSEHSSHSNEVFSGNEDTKAEDSSSNANVPVSPSQRDEPPANYVPAPPPKENIWEKRKTTLSPQQQKDGGPKSPTADGTAPATQPKQPQSHAAASRGSEPRSPGSQSTAPKSPSAEGASPTSRPSAANQKKDFVPADPPKENPWARKKQEVESTPPVHRTEPAVTNPPPPSGAWGRGASTGDRGRGGRGGRGGGPSDRGRGRGARPQKQQRERQLPTSIEDMPKLEEKSTKDFSVSNKFSGLVEDEHDGGNDE